MANAEQKDAVQRARALLGSISGQELPPKYRCNPSAPPTHQSPRAKQNLFPQLIPAYSHPLRTSKRKLRPQPPTLLPPRPRGLSPMRNRIPRSPDTASYYPGYCELYRLRPKVSFKPCYEFLTPEPSTPRHRTPTRPSVSNRYPPLHHMFVAPPPH